MTPEDWLENATADAKRRGLPDVRVPLEGLARAAAQLRAADWNEDASGRGPGSGAPAPSR
jgi:hypothetical protein